MGNPEQFEFETRIKAHEEKMHSFDGYDGDRYTQVQHLSLPKEVQTILGWDESTYLLGTISEGKLIFKKDTEKPKKELAYKIDSLQRNINSCEVDIGEKQEKLKKLNEMMNRLKNSNE